MLKSLKRVILLAILITLVHASFWPWEDEAKDKKKSKKSKKSRNKEADENYDVTD